MAAASNHPRILIPKYGQMDNVKPLTANRGLPFAVRWPNLDLRVSIGHDLPWVLATFLARFPVSVTARGFRLWPKMWRPSANTANFRRTREKPLVPRVVMICCWHITDLNIKLIITIWPLLHLGLYVIIQIGPLLYAWIQNVFEDGTFMTLGSSFLECHF